MAEPTPTTHPLRQWRPRLHVMVLFAIILAITSSLLTFSNLGPSRTPSHDFDAPFLPPTRKESAIVPETLTSGEHQRSPSSDQFPSFGTNNNATRSKRKSERSNSNSSNSGGGLHVCTCLTDDNPRNANLPETPKRLRWLHIPKTGTSFISTLWGYATSNSDRYIDLSVNSYVCGQFDNTAYNMHDFALMKRYPWEIYGAPNMIPPTTSKSSSSTSAPSPVQEDMHLGLVGGTQHTPLAPNYKDRQYTTSRHYQKIRPKLWRNHGSEFYDSNVTVVAFFRQPEERIVSAFYDGRHSNGFPDLIWKELIRSTAEKPSTSKTKSRGCVIDSRWYHHPLMCFARFPGIAGCMSRMLTGETCADGILQESGLENLPYAFDIVMNHLDFVGLTEDWNESICQFHRLYMGKLDKPGGKRYWDVPLQGEFSNVHKGKEKRLGVESLNGFKDLADTVVYDAAKLKFERMVGGERCYKYMTHDEIKERKQSNYAADMPFVKTDDNGNVCVPMSCSDLGKQCGEWNDGCGKTIICGMCDVGRTGLPSTWRVQCVEGQCVDYCPPWNEKGYWFLSDDSPSVVRETIQEQSEHQQKYLSPVDAVQICEVACANTWNEEKSPPGIESFINTGLCKCGTTPSILKANLTLQDFSSAHALNAMCRETKARKEAVLLEDDTQPICCPYIPREPDLPIGWKRLYAMGGDNFEGEYFEHIRMECGGFKECESVARQKQAEMAVFDLSHSMCYLARNVVKFEDIFTVTKDNRSRVFIDLRNGATS